MEKITGLKIKAKDAPTFTWHADLVAFDGPLISLFTSDSETDALFVWLDCDDRRNRWAIVEAPRAILVDYLKAKLSLLKVFESTPSIFVFDQIGEQRRNWMTVQWADLPKPYVPKPDSLLSPQIRTTAAQQLAVDATKRYSIKLNGEMFIGDLERISRMYQQLYSFLYGLSHLGQESVRTAISSSVTQWTGGMSSVNLFSGLSSLIPSIHRPRITKLQFASPGEIELELLLEIAGHIQASSQNLTAEKKLAEGEDLYKQVYKYFRSAKLSGFEEKHSPKHENLTEDQRSTLASYVQDFLRLLALSSSAAQFDALDIGPLAQLRALLAYYRRLRIILQYERKGVVQLPPVPQSVAASLP